MVSKKEKNQYRGELFRHLDGIATAPTVYCLGKKGILDAILKQKAVDLTELAKTFQANEGYLNVALRTLASQGWLEYKVDNAADTVSVAINERSSVAFAHWHWYKEAVTYMNNDARFNSKNLGTEKFRLLAQGIDCYTGAVYPLSGDAAEQAVQEQIRKHIEGVLIGSVTVFMAMDGMFHNYFMEASFRADEFHEDPENFSKILDFFAHLGWFTKRNTTYTFTEKGLFFAKRATAYGVTVSYIPTFRKVENLLFGDFSGLRQHDNQTPEVHVDRVMNVWGSGGAHAAYFKKIDEIIIDIFNRPLEEQPKGILDMGCGNGAFLIHLFDVIENKTLRGKHLEEHPIFLIGADFNKEALKVTRANLIKADIWAKVTWGDIGDPQRLERDIFEDYAIRLDELLNVRTFLDHNRIWDNSLKADKTTTDSSGAFAHRGRRLPNNRVAQSLKEHLGRWKPYIKTYGLILIELHTVAPELTAKNLGKTAATAYDATHGYSDQYIVELNVFLQTLSEIGLSSDPRFFSKFPDSNLATVSVHYVRE